MNFWDTNPYKKISQTEYFKVITWISLLLWSMLYPKQKFKNYSRYKRKVFIPWDEIEPDLINFRSSLIPYSQSKFNDPISSAVDRYSTISVNKGNF